MSWHDPTWQPDFEQGFYGVYCALDEDIHRMLDLLTSDPVVALREGCCAYAAVALHERYGFDIYVVGRVGMTDHLVIGAVDEHGQTWLLDGAGCWRADDLVEDMRKQYAPTSEWFWAKANYSYARFTLAGNILGLGAQTDTAAYDALVNACDTAMHDHMAAGVEQLRSIAGSMTA